MTSTINGTFTLPNVEGHPELFLGPNAVSMVVQSIETGFLMSQALHFATHMEHEPRGIKFIVGFVTAAAL